MQASSTSTSANAAAKDNNSTHSFPVVAHIWHASTGQPVATLHSFGPGCALLADDDTVPSDDKMEAAVSRSAAGRAMAAELVGVNDDTDNCWRVTSLLVVGQHGMPPTAVSTGKQSAAAAADASVVVATLQCVALHQCIVMAWRLGAADLEHQNGGYSAIAPVWCRRLSGHGIGGASACCPPAPLAPADVGDMEGITSAGVKSAAERVRSRQAAARRARARQHGGAQTVIVGHSKAITLAVVDGSELARFALPSTSTASLGTPRSAPVYMRDTKTLAVVRRVLVAAGAAVARSVSSKPHHNRAATVAVAAVCFGPARAPAWTALQGTPGSKGSAELASTRRGRHAFAGAGSWATVLHAWHPGSGHGLGTLHLPDGDGVLQASSVVWLPAVGHGAGSKEVGTIIVALTPRRQQQQQQRQQQLVSQLVLVKVSAVDDHPPTHGSNSRNIALHPWRELCLQEACRGPCPTPSRIVSLEVVRRGACATGDHQLVGDVAVLLQAQESAHTVVECWRVAATSESSTVAVTCWDSQSLAGLGACEEVCATCVGVEARAMAWPQAMVAEVVVAGEGYKSGGETVEARATAAARSKRVAILIGASDGHILCKQQHQ